MPNDCAGSCDTGTNNRLLSDGTYRYQYDAEGNRTHRFIDTNANGQLDAGDTDITQYTWDHRNRLTKVEHRSSYAAAVDHVVEYAYDYANRWVYKRLDDDGDGHAEQRRIFIYDGNQIVMDFWRTNSGDMQVGHLRQRYLWGPAVDQILAEEAVDGGTADLVQWTLTDHLNTVRDIAKYDPGSDMTTAVNHLIYDAFGKVTSESNPAVDSLFLFTARPFDADTGLQNNLHRWYDARVGRWLSEDPIGFAAGDGNLYRYVGNRSLTAVDPEGLTLWYRGTLTYRVIQPIRTISVVLPAKGSSGLSKERIQKLVEDATREWAKNDGKIIFHIDKRCPAGTIPGPGQRIRVAQQFEGELRIFVKLSRRFFGLFGDWTAVIVTDPRKEHDQWSLGTVLFLAVYQKEFYGECGPCCEKT